MNRLVTLFSFSVIGLASAFPAHGQDAVTIQWTELAADRALFQDPLAKLSPEQLRGLGYVLRVSQLIADEKVSATGLDASNAQKISQKLKKQGVDVGWLLVQRERIRDIREHQLRDHAASVADKLKGKQVVLTGFVVPINVKDNLATEFFLVPSVSMCSHGSFPPSTQMVYVKHPQGIALENRATAITVTGAIKQQTTKETFAYPGTPVDAEAQYAMTLTKIKVVESRIAQTDK